MAVVAVAEEEAAVAPRVLLDPAGLEQRLAQGMLYLALTPQRELAVVHKAGGLPLRLECLWAPCRLQRNARWTRGLVGCVRGRGLVRSSW